MKSMPSDSCRKELLPLLPEMIKEKLLKHQTAVATHLSLHKHLVVHPFVHVVIFGLAVPKRQGQSTANAQSPVPHQAPQAPPAFRAPRDVEASGHVVVVGREGWPQKAPEISSLFPEVGLFNHCNDCGFFDQNGSCKQLATLRYKKL